MKIIVLSIFIFLFYLQIHAQKSTWDKPYSFDNELVVRSIKKNDNPNIVLTSLDFTKIADEDRINFALGKPFRFGIPISVDLNLNNSGVWFELENGDRLWLLTIKCPSAKSINLTYDQFWLPNGGLLYLYDKTKTMYIGGFSKDSNKGTKEKPSKFVTGLIYSDEIVLEYYEPKSVNGEGIISISNVVYGYRDMLEELDIDSGSSISCYNNINCSPEGDDWQDEKTSVAKMAMSGYACSGSLINNTREDGTPYFLTANHCIAALNLDAISNPDASDFIFYWNNENEACEDGPPFLPPYTIGATVVANNTPTDFALLKLVESPYELSPMIQAYFSGWDRQTPTGKSVGIHHPEGMKKKISIDNDSPNSSGNLWQVCFDSTTNGYSILNSGSSGSPLYNDQSRIIGQAWAIDGRECTSQCAYYGKFNVSWNNGSEARRKLSSWLDPDNSGTNYLDGTYCNSTEYISDINFSSDTTIYGCSLNIQNVVIESGAGVTFNFSSNLLIDSQFEVELGAEIEIK